MSHSHVDRAAGFQYLTPLYEEGYEFWYDRALTPTNPWNGGLAEAIESCALFVLLVSPVSVEREVVNREVHHAVHHGKPILCVHLQDTPLPSELQFQVGRIHAIRAHALGLDDAVDRIREQLDAHHVTKGGQRRPADDAPPSAAGRPVEGMPGRAGRRQVSVSDAFADRVPESEALANSVRRQRAALLGQRPVSGETHENVLVFYGGGGVGKSGLSRQLERWVTGGLSEAGDWGPWPGGAVVPVRWDFNDADGDVQYADLLRVLRQALRAVPHTFLAFDLGLAAYLEAVSTRGQPGLGLNGAVATEVLASLQVIAARQRAGVPTQLDALAVQRVVSGALKREPADLLGDFDLAEFLSACDRIPQGSQAPELVAELAYLLTQEIFYLPEAERPALVFFIDHFERVQRRAGSSHEPGLARIIADLPYALFVVTGRDKLNWADPGRTDLLDAGPHAWPGLADGAVDDPRQHILERLSDEDTYALYQQHRDRHGWQMSDGLVEKLVQRSEGLPIHIAAVLKLAGNLHKQEPDRRFDAADLDRDLPDVVLRLLDVLTPEERSAFRGACVLPFFDVELAAKVGGVSQGDVQRAIRYALVDENRDSRYQYRVHDEIRRLVRQDRSSHGYWSDGDWRAAAERGLAEAKRLVVMAHAAEDESAEVQALVLAIRLAHEWDLRDTGLEQMTVDAPSIAMLAPFLPIPSGEVETLTESGGLIRFVHACALNYSQSIEPLRLLAETSIPVASPALRFHAYHLRSRNCYDEALTALEKGIEQAPDGAAYLHFQYAITLRGARRFRDALDYAEAHVSQGARLQRFSTVLDRHHGLFASDTAGSRSAYRNQVVSSRVHDELAATSVAVDTLLGRANEHEVTALLEQALRRRARGNVRTCLRALAYFHLPDAEKYIDIVDRVRRGMEEDESLAHTATHLLALRALMTRDPADARAAYDDAREGPRGPSWIATEVWLEELGHPLDPMPTQWLIPYERVRQNWLNVADGIIERAKRGMPE